MTENTKKLFEHPFFLANKDDWTKYRDLYEGKHSKLTTETYLWPHQLEKLNDPLGMSTKLRQIRQQRTRYVKFMKMMVSIWTNWAFKADYETPEEVKALLGDNENNIDGKGNSLFTFMKDSIFRDYALYGKAINLVSSPNIQATSKAEERALGARAYFNSICPLDFKDWSIVTSNPARLNRLSFGRYEYEMITERVSENQQPETVCYSDVLKSDGKNYQIQKYYRKKENSSQSNNKALQSSEDEWTTYGDPILTELQEIPLVIISSEPWVDDIAEEILRNFNDRSCYDNARLHQAYQRLGISGADPSDENMVKYLTESNLFFIKNPQARLLIAEPADLSVYERSLAESTTTIFRLGLNQIRALPMDSRAAQSQDAMIEEKANTYALVESALGEIEGLVNQSLVYYAEIQGDDNFNAEITLNKEFTEDDWTQFIAVYNAFAPIFNSIAPIKLGAAKKALSKLGIDKELEDMGMIALEDLARKPAETQVTQQSDAISNVINGQ